MEVLMGKSSYLINRSSLELTPQGFQDVLVQRWRLPIAQETRATASLRSKKTRPMLLEHRKPMVFQKNKTKQLFFSSENPKFSEKIAKFSQKLQYVSLCPHEITLFPCDLKHQFSPGPLVKQRLQAVAGHQTRLFCPAAQWHSHHQGLQGIPLWLNWG